MTENKSEKIPKEIIEKIYEKIHILELIKKSKEDQYKKTMLSAKLANEKYEYSKYDEDMLTSMDYCIKNGYPLSEYHKQWIMSHLK